MIAHNGIEGNLKNVLLMVSVRYTLLALIFLLALTLVNALYARTEHDRSLSNPYSGPHSVFGSVVGAAVTPAQSNESQHNFQLREIPIVIVTGVAFALSMRRFSQPRNQG